MVENGYSTVVRHPKDSTDKSPFYDDLLAAQDLAINAAKGLHGKKPPSTKNIVDASESIQKATIQASVLQRQKRVPGVVDFVKSGSRLAIIVPRESIKLTFVLSGINAPKSARNATDKGEPFGQEAHDFTVRRCWQRDVEIDVEGLDKVGGFIGTLYIGGLNFAKILLEEGLAKVVPYAAEKAGHKTEYLAAEKLAKVRRLQHPPMSTTDS
jgi:staphylococcal nuclease domain-containing protein 1